MKKNVPCKLNQNCYNLGENEQKRVIIQKKKKFSNFYVCKTIIKWTSVRAQNNRPFRLDVHNSTEWARATGTSRLQDRKKDRSRRLLPLAVRR